jgi:hypothetical protein
MKITLFAFALFILCTASAFGQVGAAVLSSQPVIIKVPDHPQHAERMALASEHSLVGGGESTYTYAIGERPLWEFGSPLPAPVPLGDVARAFRKEKQSAKKADVVLEKQGS